MTLAETRALRPDDLPGAHALTAALGWPQRPEDWQFMLARGDGVAAERDGVLIGTGMAWRYGTDGGAVGMIAVAPDAQGQGLGRRIFERVLAGLDARHVVLHATEAGLKLYRSMGFVACGIIRQHQGAVLAGEAVALAAGERLLPLRPEEASSVAALDAAATGMDRSPLLAALRPQSEGMALDRGGEVIGFALVRRFGRGEVIGPVIAPDLDRARALIDACLAPRIGRFVRVDAPEAAGLGPWLTARGLVDVEPVVRMERGAGARPGAFALISQAFG